VNESQAAGGDLAGPHGGEEGGERLEDFQASLGLAALLEVQQLDDVVGSPRLDPRPEGRLAHSSEGLPQHDRTGGDAVDVEVPGLDLLQPELLLAVVEALEPRGESVTRLVRQGDGLPEVLRPQVDLALPKTRLLPQ